MDVVVEMVSIWGKYGSDHLNHAHLGVEQEGWGEVEGNGRH